MRQAPIDLLEANNCAGGKPEDVRRWNGQSNANPGKQLEVIL